MCEANGWRKEMQTSKTTSTHHTTKQQNQENYGSSKPCATQTERTETPEWGSGGDRHATTKHI